MYLMNGCDSLASKPMGIIIQWAGLLDWAPLIHWGLITGAIQWVYSMGLIHRERNNPWKL